MGDDRGQWPGGTGGESAPGSVRGLFVTFEGGEGAGKSTQMARLGSRLTALGREIVPTREPGGSHRAEAIRRILLEGHAKRYGSAAEAVLFAAARGDHVARLIGPALDRGAIVLCDRFIDSTRVYQADVAGVPERLVARLETVATGGRRPDLTVILDLPAAIGLARAQARRDTTAESADRFEVEGRTYHERVRSAFLSIAEREPARCTVIDASAPPDLVEAAVWRAVEPCLGQGGSRRGG